MSQQSESDYLRTAQVAKLLKVSAKTISRWAKENRLPFVKTLGGHRRFPAPAIHELAKELSSEGSDRRGADDISDM